MRLLKIDKVAKKAGIPASSIEPYGFYKAKVDPIKVKPRVADSKLILVTAITPTKAGEGKTTTSIALAEGFGKIGQPAMLCLREPALGPVFGLKGGATGGGRATIEPGEDINLHFNGDFHALTSSINLIAAVIDNSLFQGNPLDIDPERIVWKRAMDMNDRSLREITVAQGQSNGTPHPSGFLITVASELMAIMCLAKDEEDFQDRLEQIIVAYNKGGKPLRVKDFRVSHAVMKLMKEALKPNLVQTIEGQPVLVHGGPFANIAHGCNSLIALKLASLLSPIVITEAGFGADLGAEKFLDIVSPLGGLKPSLAVVVATVRALKLHGGVPFEELEKENLMALKEGVENLRVHAENMAKYSLPVLIAINHFKSDTKKETDFLIKWCEENGYRVAFNKGYALGGEGAKDMAKACLDILNEVPSAYHPLIEEGLSIKEKIEKIAREIYRADGVEFSDRALEQIAQYEELGYGDAYVCMAKTPASLSDSPKALNVPKGHIIHVRECDLSAGANFIVALTGKVMTMPGLPKVPAAVKMEDEPWR